MNKTVNINLAGLFFHIDEEAYLKLQRYLEAIKKSFTDSQGRNEIVSDIEARIAELFNERVKMANQVIGINEVDEVINIMGQPEDYLVDDDIFEDEPKADYNKKSTVKKLYRDTENSYVSGVSAGLGHYLNVDAIWIRLAWLLLVVGGFGSGILIYILLWIFVPEAQTTTEKLHMTGEAATISNIEKKIRDGFHDVSENLKNVDFQKHGDRLKEGLDNVSDAVSSSVNRVKNSSNLKNTSTNFFDTIGNIIMFIVKLIAKFVGVILMFAGIMTFVGTIISILTVGLAQSVHFPGLDFVELSQNSGTPIWLMTIITIAFVGILAFFIFYLGLKMVAPKSKSIGNPAKYSLLGIWLVALIAFTYLSIKQGMSYNEEAKISTKESIFNITKNDTLRIVMQYDDTYTESFSRNRKFKVITNQFGDKEVFSQNIRLQFKPTRDSVAKIKVDKSANGYDYEEAKKRAENISYNYNLEDKTLLLNNFFLVDNQSIQKDQEVFITVYLPIGTSLYLDENTYRYNFLGTDKDETYLIMGKKKLICPDCDDYKDDNDNEDYEISLNINGKNSIIKIDSDGIKSNSENLQLIIDSTGIKSNSENLKIDINENQFKVETKNE